jgi:ribonuclease P protein component
MHGLGFPGRYKLKKTDEFSSVFNFRKRITGTILALHYMPNLLGYARLGLIVGKKTAKRSVQRNYMKRVLRELMRCELVNLGAMDILIRPLVAYSHDDFPAVRSELMLMLEKLKKRNLI